MRFLTLLFSGHTTLSLELWPLSGSIPMDVGFPSCRIYAFVLTGLSASPAEQFFTQSNGLYVGGDQSAFAARYLAPVTSIVSPGFRFRDASANSFLRRSSLSLSELVRLALRPWTLMN